VDDFKKGDLVRLKDSGQLADVEGEPYDSSGERFITVVIVGDPGANGTPVYRVGLPVKDLTLVRRKNTDD